MIPVIRFWYGLCYPHSRYTATQAFDDICFVCLLWAFFQWYTKLTGQMASVSGVTMGEHDIPIDNDLGSNQFSRIRLGRWLVQPFLMALVSRLIRSNASLCLGYEASDELVSRYRDLPTTKTVVPMEEMLLAQWVAEH